MSHADVLKIIFALIGALGSGCFGAWLVHKRLSPKSRAEARDITAAAQDKDWKRFEREISRLVKRLESAEDAAQRALIAQRECEAREIKLKGRIVELEAWQQQEGEARKLAAGIVAQERNGVRA